jgi:phosphoribosylaminoimidazolecarboxamide formyltransferase/IMP cyclohydrolase
LQVLGYELVSTGGSARSLTEAGLAVTTVADLTGFPEILDGRVKTLHPTIHAGLLARRDRDDHMAKLHELGIDTIDILVSNLYPFRETVSDPASTEEDKIEQIDIGGPAMVRAAAKNFAGVLVVTSPNDYDEIATSLESGEVNLEYRRQLAAKAFHHVSAYDSMVADFLSIGSSEQFPHELAIGMEKIQNLRYGENPQQGAAVYRTYSSMGHVGGVLDAAQLHGKELSYNNLLDADAAGTRCKFQGIRRRRSSSTWCRVDSPHDPRSPMPTVRHSRETPLVRSVELLR